MRTRVAHSAVGSGSVHSQPLPRGLGSAVVPDPRYGPDTLPPSEVSEGVRRPASATTAGPAGGGEEGGEQGASPWGGREGVHELQPIESAACLDDDEAELGCSASAADKAETAGGLEPSARSGEEREARGSHDVMQAVGEAPAPHTIATPSGLHATTTPSGLQKSGSARATLLQPQLVSVPANVNMRGGQGGSARWKSSPVDRQLPSSSSSSPTPPSLRVPKMAKFTAYDAVMGQHKSVPITLRSTFYYANEGGFSPIPDGPESTQHTSMQARAGRGGG